VVEVLYEELIGGFDKTTKHDRSARTDTVRA
jgi:hypothetical protein